MTSPVETWRRISQAYFEHCWNSTERPHRQPILDAVASLMPEPANVRLLEVGCNAGANLRLIHGRWPEVGLYGMDANSAALDYLLSQPLPVEVWDGDIRDLLPQFTHPFDIVLSCYCLAYIEPGEIADVLAHMVRIARVGLVIAEPMMFSGDSKLVYDGGLPEWAHNYHQHFATRSEMAIGGVAKNVAIVRVDPPVERLNAVLTVRL